MFTAHENEAVGVGIEWLGELKLKARYKNKYQRQSDNGDPKKREERDQALG